MKRARTTVRGKLLSSSSLPSICFNSRIVVQQSATPPASTPMVNLTADTLKRHNVGTKFNAAMRGTCTDVLSQPSVTSSMANISSDSEDLPHWLEKDETWSVEIGPWNSVGGYMKFC